MTYSVQSTVLSDAACTQVSGQNCAQQSCMDDTLIIHLLDMRVRVNDVIVAAFKQWYIGLSSRIKGQIHNLASP